MDIPGVKARYPLSNGYPNKDWQNPRRQPRKPSQGKPHDEVEISEAAYELERELERQLEESES